MTVERDGHKFWVVTLEVPKGTKIKSPWSGQFYHGWQHVKGQSMPGITVEYPSVKEFQRGISVNAVDLVFNKEQHRMVKEGEVVAETGKAGKVFFYFGGGPGNGANDEEMLYLHFPHLFKM